MVGCGGSYRSHGNMEWMIYVFLDKQNNTCSFSVDGYGVSFGEKNMFKAVHVSIPAS